MKQNDRLICHFAICKSLKRGNGIEVIEDILPIYNVELAIKTDKKINKVYLHSKGKI